VKINTFAGGKNMDKSKTKKEKSTRGGVPVFDKPGKKRNV
jgi:hypothetical protein